MPTINRPPKKEKKSTYHSDTDMRQLRQKAYQSSQWKKLRETYVKQHPICEDCLSKGKVTPAVDIHHNNSPFKTGEINWHLLLDYDNLSALCKECHSLRHNKENGYKSPEEIINELDRLLEQ